MNTNPFGFEGKVAAVTGGASGLGRATVRRLLKAGARVAILDVDEANSRELEAAVGATSACFIRCDVTEATEVEPAIAEVTGRFGGLDVLVNSAGISAGRGRTGETDPDAWHRTIAVNLTGTFLATRYAIPAMGSSGAIVNIASIFGLQGFPGDVAYAASKGGVIQITRTAALEYAKRGIRVNCICPGYVDTPLVSAGGDSKPIEALATLAVPMGRPGTPDEVVEMIAFLASDSAAFITGAIISVDGGMSAR